ncbi:aspartate racemase [Pedobacter cryoconitis]|uniref:aspartate/glutamate racemase family protein n=1 Tax=Pedobacter cryoconitis TaxID=188932 RepID=UPI00160E5BC7|nr:amino acid racemase [Pedobacter cryoconitis]MBB6271700.1 aspartate racemase [Pedobacter cryoconitis]
MIGIVGGVGPLAGVDLVRKIIEETPAHKDQEHVQVVLLSLPDLIPDRTEFLIGNENVNPGVPISKILLQLEKAGAVVAGIPCNTAHAPLIFNLIRAELKRSGSYLKVLDMVEETAVFLLNEHKYQKIGVLSTTGTLRTGIYKTVLNKYGFEVLEVENLQHQDKIHEAIYNPLFGIKAVSSPVTQEARDILMRSCDELINRGAEIIILGCSEISIALTETFIGTCPLIDPSRVLAKALLKFIGVPEYSDADCDL